MSSTTNPCAWFFHFSQMHLYIVDLFESASKQGPPQRIWLLSLLSLFIGIMVHPPFFSNAIFVRA